MIDASGARGRSRVPGAFRHRNFRLYWTGQLVSLVGTHMQRAAQAWLVLTLTDDPFLLGVLAAAQFGPILFLGPFGGLVADSLPKHRTIVVTQVIAMILAFTLALLTATGSAQVWHVLLMALLLGVTNVVDIPMRQTFVMEMVGRDDVVNAVALNSTLLHAAKLVGPALAGIAIAVVDISVAFLLNGVSYMAVIAGLVMMRATELYPTARVPLPTRPRAVIANLGQGLSYVVHTPSILLALLVVGLVSTVAMNFQVLLPPLARDVLRTDASGFGFLMAASGLGAIAGALTIAFRGRPRGMLFLGAAAVLGATEVALAFSSSLPAALLCMTLIGVASVVMTTNVNTQIQMNAPDHLRGRVMALYVTVHAGSTPVGGLVFGAIAGAYGTAAALAIGGSIAVVIALLALVVGLWSRSMDIGGPTHAAPVADDQLR